MYCGAIYNNRLMVTLVNVDWNFKQAMTNSIFDELNCEKYEEQENVQEVIETQQYNEILSKNNI